MPELIKNGPLLPVELLNQRDAQQVVFFCGAGISMGTGLPSFAGLVSHIYRITREKPDAVENEALDLRQKLKKRRHPKFDKALGLLERDSRLGSERLRKVVINRLTRRWSRPLPVHKALLRLSATAKGYRLVTTNFDDRFSEAGLKEKFINAGPRLPIPKRHAWHTVVHIHGRIQQDDDGSDLVLTAADFGRAYLTERWAARFITELFREFTVVFIGYTLDDPVMAYMVDALAAERAKGRQFGRAYAFAEHDTDPESKRAALEGWQAKSVEPILFDRRDHYALLNETLTAWAGIVDDPYRARNAIALTEINKMPDGPTDPVAERVTWALTEVGAATALATSPPITQEKNFLKLEAWLEVFDETGLLSKAADPASIIAPLVDGGRDTSYPADLDQVTLQLGRWMSQHLHVPQVLGWVVKKGGYLHPVFKNEIRRQLANLSITIPPRLRLLWTILVNRKPRDYDATLWLSEQIKNARSPAELDILELQLMKNVAPYLEVKPGPSSTLRYRSLYSGKKRRLSAIKSCAHLELSVGDDEFRYLANELLTNRERLTRNAEMLTSYLEQALNLLSKDDENTHFSYWYRPSIAASEQNDHKDDWVILVDWVRDSYFALARKRRNSASALLNRWVLSPYVLFRRLALHAITDDPESDSELLERLLLSGRNPGLWDVELRREVLRFLRIAGKRLPKILLQKIIDAILAGYRGKARNKIDSDLNHREMAIRLNKLSQSGVDIGATAGRVLVGRELLSPAEDESDEYLAWSGEVQWGTAADSVSQTVLNSPLTHIVGLMRERALDAEVVEGIAMQVPIKAASALRVLASEGVWPSHYWKRFFWAIGTLRRQQRVKLRFGVYVANIIVLAPSALLTEIGSSAGDFVEELAKECSPKHEKEFEKLWIKVWSSIDVSRQDEHDDPITQALNDTAGKLATAALHRQWKYGLKANEGLISPVRNYFDLIAKDSDGHLGRVILASRLYHLFVIDPEWTSRNLITRLTPVTSKEAQDLWESYSWSPTVGPNLLAAFKEGFLSILRYEDANGRRKENLFTLFISICLDAPTELKSGEIRKVMDALSEAPLVSILDALSSRLIGSADERAIIWQDKIGPWLKTYWPQAAARNTSKTTLAMLQLISKTGSEFPSAVAWALINLKPITERGLHYLKDSEVIISNPEECLKILKKIVTAVDLPKWDRGTLGSLLEKMRAAHPQIAADLTYQEMHVISVQ